MIVTISINFALFSGSFGKIVSMVLNPGVDFAQGLRMHIQIIILGNLKHFHHQMGVMPEFNVLGRLRRPDLNQKMVWGMTAANNENNPLVSC